MKILILFLISFNISAGDFVRDLKFSKDKQTLKLDIKNNKEIKETNVNKKKQVIEVLRSNQQITSSSPWRISAGMTRDEYFQSKGIFVQEFSPQIGLAKDFLFERFSILLDSELTQRNLILKQSLSLDYGSNFKGIARIQVGQRIAIEEQVDGDFIFFNALFGFSYSFNKLDLELLFNRSLSSIAENGFESRVLYSLDSTKVGLYFSAVNYNPTSVKEVRDGQSTMRAGFLFYY